MSVNIIQLCACAKNPFSFIVEKKKKVYIKYTHTITFISYTKVYFVTPEASLHVSAFYVLVSKLAKSKALWDTGNSVSIRQNDPEHEVSLQLPSGRIVCSAL